MASGLIVPVVWGSNLASKPSGVQDRDEGHWYIAKLRVDKTALNLEVDYASGHSLGIRESNLGDSDELPKRNATSLVTSRPTGREFRCGFFNGGKLRQACLFPREHPLPAATARPRRLGHRGAHESSSGRY